MNAQDKKIGDIVLKHLCLLGEINGVRFGPTLQVLLNGHDESKKGITGEIYLNIESRWCLYDKLPDQFPEREEDIEQMPRLKELEILNDLSFKQIVDIRLEEEVPHLIITFENDKSLFVFGHHEEFESWQLGVSFQPEDMWLVVATPGDEIAMWTPQNFSDTYL